MTEAGPQISVGQDGSLRIGFGGAFLLTVGVTMGFGLGYAKARHDSEEIIDRLADLKVDLDELRQRHLPRERVDVVDGSVVNETEETPEGATT